MKTPIMKSRPWTLLDLARRDDERSEKMYKSWSGTTVAEAEYYRLRGLFWIDLYNGQAFGRPLTFDEAFAQLDFAWRAYAQANNARVENAPKIKYGPCAGQSTIDHRWVNPDMAESDIPDLIYMAGKAKR
jgi:hypothetical protein